MANLFESANTTPEKTSVTAIYKKNKGIVSAIIQVVNVLDSDTWMVRCVYCSASRGHHLCGPQLRMNESTITTSLSNKIK